MARCQDIFSFSYSVVVCDIKILHVFHRLRTCLLPCLSNQCNVVVIALNLDNCNCNYILFTKLPWPGDSEGTFRSSSQAATCLPHTAEASHCLF